jgi:predicted Kef-type K+ transport protein
MYEICNANLPGMHEAVQASLLAGAVSSFLTTPLLFILMSKMEVSLSKMKT